MSRDLKLGALQNQILYGTKELDPALFTIIIDDARKRLPPKKWVWVCKNY